MRFIQILYDFILKKLGLQIIKVCKLKFFRLCLMNFGLFSPNQSSIGINTTHHFQDHV
jgi:hypothetical protein